MNLNNFENQIEPRILSRGLRYFDDGRVLSIEEKEPQVYEALVEGSECYTVSIALDGDGNIQETECDCPYDQGEYCKHQVAAFLALQELLDEAQDPPRPKPSSGASASSKPVRRERTVQPIPLIPKQNWKTRLEQTLKQRTKDELIQYMMDLASDDETIRQQIELRFGNEDEPAAIKQAIQVIRTHIWNASDRRGFVGYSSTFSATRGAAMVLEKARQACVRGNVQHALDLALSALHEMIALLSKCDDSDGNVGDIIAN